MMVGFGMVSIIIPAYNCEKYIARCLESVCAQTYRDIEILVIDDGSTDGTADICRRFAGADTRMELICQKNGGPSSARNKGLKLCRGEFITFVDSDDLLREDHIELLLNELTRNSSDISVIGYTVTYDVNVNTRRRDNKPEVKVYDGEAVIQALFCMDDFQGMVWAKLYRRELFENIRFPDINCYEDISIMLPLFMRCKRIVWIPEYTYYYIQRRDSLVNSGYSHQKMALMRTAAQWVRYSEGKNNIYYKESGAFYLKSLLALLLNLNSGDKSGFNADEKRLMRALGCAMRYLKDNPYIDNRKRFLLIAFNIGIPGKLISYIWSIWMIVKSRHTGYLNV
ncbi:MAG: glycosyltransferase [Lachnospiraceae bacterium]|nr:glycosyltransferase [Lachnospiraceae bacterium]